MNPDRDTLLKVLKSGKGITRSSLQNVFNVNPQNEEDRKTVWKLGQNLAHLIREGWVYVINDRYYAKV